MSLLNGRADSCLTSRPETLSKRAYGRLAMAKCSKCGNSSFEAEENSIRNSRFKYYIIQCTSCDSAIGVVDYFSISELIFRLADKLGFKL
jgi:hypothetical protein